MNKEELRKKLENMQPPKCINCEYAKTCAVYNKADYGLWCTKDIDQILALIPDEEYKIAEARQEGRKEAMEWVNSLEHRVIYRGELILNICPNEVTAKLKDWGIE
ncbi:MAG: hypothetical protein PHE15_04975 [Dehalococcoidales bacterium]|nr:hypothetical protein [Dehalococcoidales bacterium]